MSDWVVIPCLLTLRDEFNKVSPKRDKGADGTIGDSSHTSSSDHTPDEDSRVLQDHDGDSKNEVHALDIDSSGPWPDKKAGNVKGSWFDKQIHRIIAEEKRRWEDPNDMCRLNYIIWLGVIYDKDNDWVGKKYTGSDPHTNHAHLSGRYEAKAESDTRSWGVYIAPKPEGGFMADITQANFNKLMDGWASTTNGQKLIAQAVLSARVGNKTTPQRDVANVLGDLGNQLRPAFVFPADHAENKTSGMPTDAPIWALLAMPDRLTALEKSVATLISKSSV